MHYTIEITKKDWELGGVKHHLETLKEQSTIKSVLEKNFDLVINDIGRVFDIDNQKKIKLVIKLFNLYIVTWNEVIVYAPKKVQYLMSDDIEIINRIQNELYSHKYTTTNSCMLTGEISNNNVELANGKIVLSKDVLHLLHEELEEYLIASEMDVRIPKRYKGE